MAGIYFAVLFAIRGFGITAGTHAFYNIIAVSITAPGFSRSRKQKASAYFLIFFKKLSYCYSFRLLSLHKNRPIRADNGLINTNMSLEYVYEFWYNKSNLEVKILY